MLETRNHLLDGRSREYFDPTETRDLLRLTGRAIAATTSLLRYLHGCKGKAPTGWDVEPTEPHEPDEPMNR